MRTTPARSCRRRNASRCFTTCRPTSPTPIGLSRTAPSFRNDGAVLLNPIGVGEVGRHVVKQREAFLRLQERAGVVRMARRLVIGCHHCPVGDELVDGSTYSMAYGF